MISGSCEPLNHWKVCWTVPSYPRHTHFSEHHSDSSNPTASNGRGSVPDRGHAKPQCFDDSRDSKNDSIWVARREMQAPHDAMLRASMGATELQSCWLEMRKTLGKRGFCSMGFRKLAERTGTEHLAVFLRFWDVRRLLINVGLRGQQTCCRGAFG